MKTKYLASILTLLLFASIFTFGLTIQRASASTATLSISSVAKIPSDVGTSFTVPVNISDVSDLFGFDIKITWDNSLITLSSLDDSSLNTVFAGHYLEPLTPPYQTGDGYVRFAAVKEGTPGFSGSATLFTLTFNIVEADNLPHSTPIQFDPLNVKLSDSAANSITPTFNDGTYTMSAITPGITFTKVNPNTNKPYEFGKYVEVQVYATNINTNSPLTGYDLRVDYSSEFLTFVQVQPTDPYVLATPTVDTSISGVVHLSLSSGGSYHGSSGLLFTLTFQIIFDQRSTHIWKTSTSPNQFSATISLETTTGSLTLGGGTTSIGSVTLPTDVTVPVNLIQGDVSCDGHVDILDLSTVAAYFDQSTASGPAAKYDVKVDSNNIIDIYDLVIVAANYYYYKPDVLP